MARAATDEEDIGIGRNGAPDGGNTNGVEE
jgi:hypothetical protein